MKQSGKQWVAKMESARTSFQDLRRHVVKFCLELAKQCLDLIYDPSQ